MSTSSFTRLLVSGFFATLALTVFFYPAFVFGVPLLDFATTVGAWLGREPSPPLSEIWWQGVGEHFFNGTFVFPLLYALVGYRSLPGRPLVKGLLWGTALFLVSQYFFVPMRGLGMFSSQAEQPQLFLVASLLSCLFYGAVFGAATGRLQDEETSEAYTRHHLPSLPPQRTAA